MIGSWATDKTADNYKNFQLTMLQNFVDSWDHWVALLKLQ